MRGPRDAQVWEVAPFLPVGLTVRGHGLEVGDRLVLECGVEPSPRIQTGCPACARRASALSSTVVSPATSSRRASSIPIASCQASWSISNLRSEWFADMQVSVDFLNVNLCEKDNYRCGIRYHITDAAKTMKVAQKDLVGLNGQEKVRDGT